MSGFRPADIPSPGAWALQGVCRGVDTDVFFPTRGGVPGAARQLCDRCPVAAPCRTYALTYPGLQGIWGGTSGKDRRRIRIERREAS